HLKPSGQRNRKRRRNGVTRTRHIGHFSRNRGQMHFPVPRFEQRHAFGAASDQERRRRDLFEQRSRRTSDFLVRVNRFSRRSRRFFQIRGHHLSALVVRETAR